MAATKVREAALELYKEAECKKDHEVKNEISKHFFLKEYAQKVLTDILKQNIEPEFQIKLGNLSWHLNQYGNPTISWDSIDLHTNIEDLHFKVSIKKDKVNSLSKDSYDIYFNVYVEINNKWEWVLTLTHLGQLLAECPEDEDN